MTDHDPYSLRPWLDEQENFARSIEPTDPRFEIAKRMIQIIAEARSSFAPSSDGTANYVPGKQIIEDLSVLRSKADRIASD